MKKRTTIIVSVLMLIIGSYLTYEYLKDETTVLEIGIYSGNEWGVPQIDVYKIYDEAIALFEKEHENVKVVYRSGTLMEDYSEWLAQKILKGNEPDVFIVLQEDFNTFAEIGMLEPLNDFMKNDNEFYAEDFYEKALKSGTYNDEQFAMPFQIVPTFMIANQSLLTGNNLILPKNSWS